MDLIRFEIERTEYPAWGPVDAVGIFINGRDLVDLTREIEIPSADRAGNPHLAGDYAWLPAKTIFPPSRRLMGEPDWRYDTGGGGISVLGCGGCGDVGCWPLQVRIEVRDDVVRWNGFRQPHRSGWDYSGMGPFVFDREAYETALKSPDRSENR